MPFGELRHRRPGRGWLAIVLTVIRLQTLALYLEVYRPGWLAGLAGWQGLAGTKVSGVKGPSPGRIRRIASIGYCCPGKASRDRLAKVLTG